MKRAWINLGVGVGCVGLLLSLLLPAVMKAREDARRSHCKNNLRQWGLALLNYQDVFNMFPPYAGGTHENGERLSGRVMLMPQLGWEVEVWHKIGSTSQQGGDPMTLLKDLVVDYRETGGERFLYLDRVQNLLNDSCWVCPSSVVPPKVDQQPHVSYMFCAGDQLDFGDNGGVEDFPNHKRTQGVFGWRSGVSIRRITDGTSNTIAMAERDLGTPNDRRDPRGRVAKVAATSPADCVNLTSDGRYLSAVTVLPELMGERWASGHPIYSVFLTAIPPNGPSCAASAPPSGASVGGWFTASSRLPGGCHALFCDGTVRFVNETINTDDLTAVGPKFIETKGEVGGQRAWSGFVSSYGIWGSWGRMDDSVPGAY